MDIDARRFYGLGLFVLGVGNLLFGLGQLLGGPQPWYLALVELLAGGSLAVLGWLVLTDSERLSSTGLSDRLSVLVGAISLLFGLLLLLGGALLLV